MSNFNLSELDKGIEVLETELKALKFNGYTGFFHNIKKETREVAQSQGLNFEEIYQTTIECLEKILKMQKTLSRYLKHIYKEKPRSSLQN